MRILVVVSVSLTSVYLCRAQSGSAPETRSQARLTALGLLTQGLDGTDDVGVFTIDQSLRVLQDFTSDATLLRHAIEGAGVESSPTSSYHYRAKEVEELWKELELLQQ